MNRSFILGMEEARNAISRVIRLVQTHSTCPDRAGEFMHNYYCILLSTSFVARPKIARHLAFVKTIDDDHRGRVQYLHSTTQQF